MLIVTSVATACAFAHEGNCSSRTESVRTVTNAAAVKVNTEDLIITLYHL
ncbi:MAG: hypothetical protein ACJ72C_05250 [Nitrososphaeraceae archaeon]